MSRKNPFFRALCLFLAVPCCGSLLTACRTQGTTPPSSHAPVETVTPDTLPSQPSDTVPPQPDTETSLTDPLVEVENDNSTIMLPASSSDFSFPLSAQLLTFADDYKAENSASHMQAAGFSVIEQKNYDKADDDRSHTCAFTVGKGKVMQGETARDALLVVIRGTSGGEWYSNFDFAPSHSNDALFAENFLAAAKDVLTSLGDLLAQNSDAPIVVCGHSRGAACANLLGVLLNAFRSPQDVYVYTYATPTTVRGSAALLRHPNIFNLINPCDPVVSVPLEAWGYSRAGTDVRLSGNAASEAQMRVLFTALLALAPDISSYYNVRHSFSHSGEGEDGMTVFELMQVFCLLLTSSASDLSSGAVSLPPQFADISPESDLYPIVTIMQKASGQTSELALRLFAQHFPGTYFSLIQAEQAK